MATENAFAHRLGMTEALAGVACALTLFAVRLAYVVRRELRHVPDAEELWALTGWRLVHGEVFRAPSSPVSLAATVGVGTGALVWGPIALCGWDPTLETIGALQGAVSGYACVRVAVGLGLELRRAVVARLLAPLQLPALLCVTIAASEGADVNVALGVCVAHVGTTVVGAALGAARGPSLAPIATKRLPRHEPPLCPPVVLETLVTGALVCSAALAVFGIPRPYRPTALALTMLGVVELSLACAWRRLQREQWRWHGAPVAQGVWTGVGVLGVALVWGVPPLRASTAALVVGSAAAALGYHACDVAMRALYASFVPHDVSAGRVGEAGALTALTGV